MAHDHVELADALDDARETVPANHLEATHWVVRGTPGLVRGCAAGDILDVRSDGTFSIVRRGGNVAAHLYAGDAFPLNDLLELRSAFDEIDGAQVEWPETRRFVVITVPAVAGFAKIEHLIGQFVQGRANVEWFFGNVYDDDGAPLNWW